MAYGTANVDNIQSSTTGTPVVFKDGNGTQIGTLCRAWVQFQGGNGNTAGTINASFNTSSITVNGTGDYTMNFTTALADNKYAAMGCGDTNNGVGPQHIQVFWNVSGNSASSPTTSGFRFGNTNSGSGVNTATICMAVFR